MAYASLADLKLALRITDTVDDVLLQVALDAATEAIDAHCNRTFVAASTATTRYFDPTDDRVETDDFYTTEGLVISVGGSVVPLAVEYVSAGYTLLPYNASAIGEPYTGFTYATYYVGGFPRLWATRRARATVTAKWGYAATIPVTVREACILQASRIFARRHSPYGVAGSPEMGSEIRVLAKVDPDVAVLLAGKVRY